MDHQGRCLDFLNQIDLVYGRSCLGRWESFVDLLYGFSAYRARQVMYQPGHSIDIFPMMYEGWAYRYSVTRAGRRQILSFLLPPQPVSPAFLHGDRTDHWVEALTDVTTMNFEREGYSNLVARDPAISRMAHAIATAEELATERRLVSVGQMTAVERVAGLIVELHSRLARRLRVRGVAFDFPLEAEHVGDALGLAATDVRRAFRMLEAETVVLRQERSLSIVDGARLAEIAGVGEIDRHSPFVA